MRGLTFLFRLMEIFLFFDPFVLVGLGLNSLRNVRERGLSFPFAAGKEGALCPKRTFQCKLTDFAEN